MTLSDQLFLFAAGAPAPAGTIEAPASLLLTFSAGTCAGLPVDVSVESCGMSRGTLGEALFLAFRSRHCFRRFSSLPPWRSQPSIKTPPFVSTSQPDFKKMSRKVLCGTPQGHPVDVPRDMTVTPARPRLPFGRFSPAHRSSRITFHGRHQHSCPASDIMSR